MEVSIGPKLPHFPFKEKSNPGLASQCPKQCNIIIIIIINVIIIIGIITAIIIIMIRVIVLPIDLLTICFSI